MRNNQVLVITYDELEGIVGSIERKTDDEVIRLLHKSTGILAYCFLQRDSSDYVWFEHNDDVVTIFNDGADKVLDKDFAICYYEEQYNHVNSTDHQVIVAEYVLKQIKEGETEILAPIYIPQSFEDDMEKMLDFFSISKEDFLTTYTYLDESDYDETKKVVDAMSDEELRNLLVKVGQQLTNYLMGELRG